MKYVVILEIPDSGFMQCIGVCDSEEEAYGAAFLAVADGMDDEKYYISCPFVREGENGKAIECREKGSDMLNCIATVLKYAEDRYGRFNQPKGCEGRLVR